MTETLVRYSEHELDALGSEADWARGDALAQAEVERVADLEEGALPNGWEATVVVGIPGPAHVKATCQLR